MARGHGAWQKIDLRLDGCVSSSALLHMIPWELSKDCEGALLTPDLLRKMV
jgi:hypothetical protein